MPDPEPKCYTQIKSLTPPKGPTRQTIKNIFLKFISFHFILFQVISVPPRGTQTHDPQIKSRRGREFHYPILQRARLGGTLGVNWFSLHLWTYSGLSFACCGASPRAPIGVCLQICCACPPGSPKPPARASPPPPQRLSPCTSERLDTGHRLTSTADLSSWAGLWSPPGLENLPIIAGWGAGTQCPGPR